MQLVPGSKSYPQLVLLAPPAVSIPGRFRDVQCDPKRHEKLLAEMQRLRARLYLDEGAIRPAQISSDGRHHLPVDERAWHLLAVDPHGEVYGCSRYMAHSNTVSFSQLGVRNSALANSGEWGTKLQAAVESEIDLARKGGVAYVEVGGWALAPQLRCRIEALRIALATYSLARTLGGCIGIGTVTRRHCSSSILRRIGGRPLVTNGVDLPPYFDPQYGCGMEILRFDSTTPNPRFEVWVNDLRDYLLAVPVLCSENSTELIPDSQAGDDSLRDKSWSLGGPLFHAVQ
jgi:hypothetical protein